MDKLKRIALIAFTMGCIVWTALGLVIGITKIDADTESNVVYANEKVSYDSDMCAMGLDIYSWTDEETGIEYLVFKGSNGISVVERLGFIGIDRNN